MKKSDFKRIKDNLTIDEETDCWGFRMDTGMGSAVVSIDGHGKLLKDVMYEMKFGRPPANTVENSCGTYKCYNPDHMVEQAEGSNGD